jgi:hypothetical protein
MGTGTHLDDYRVSRAVSDSRSLESNICTLRLATIGVVRRFI